MFSMLATATTTTSVDFNALFSSIQSTVLSMIVTIVPLAMSIYGTTFAIKKGQSLFSSVGKK